MEFMKVQCIVNRVDVPCLLRSWFKLGYLLNFPGIAIGGDVFPGSTLSDHVLRFNNIPQVIHCSCELSCLGSSFVEL